VRGKVLPLRCQAVVNSERSLCARQAARSLILWGVAAACPLGGIAERLFRAHTLSLVSPEPGRRSVNAWRRPALGGFMLV
jgi:hypothetical protein